MTILITGAGLVGCFTARVLHEQGLRPVLLELNPNRAGIDHVLGGLDIPVVQGDIQDPEVVGRTLQEHRIDTILHTAGMLTAASQTAPVRAVAVNVGGTVNLIDAARAAGVRRFVLCSSSLVFYGMVGRAREPIPGDFMMHAWSERPPLVYGVTKLSCEQIGAVLCKMFGIQFSALRFAALFGPWAGPMGGVTGIVYDKLVQQALREKRIVVNDSKLIWRGSEEFTYVLDAANALAAAATAAGEVTGAHNVSMGALYSFEDLLAFFREALPGLTTAVEVQDQGGIAGFQFSRSVPADVSSGAAFGWTPRYPMLEAIRHYAEWTRSKQFP